MSEAEGVNEKLFKAIAAPRRNLKDRAMDLADTKDLYTLVLRGHAMIQASLNDAVRVKTMNRPVFDKTRLSFKATYLLAIAHSILDEPWIPFFDALDSLRGELAHSFERDVEPRDVDMLNGKLPDYMKDVYKKAGLKEEFTLQATISLLIMTAQDQEQKHEYTRMLAYYLERAKR